MFEVVASPLGRFDCHRLINKNTLEYLEVLTSFGAGINDLMVLNGKNSLISMIDGYRSESEIAETHHSKFKGSKLSPFPNRVKAGEYNFGGTTYQLPINEVGGNNNLHAFLHNRRFQVEEIKNGDTQAELVLSYDYRGEEQGYPFFYKLELVYVFGNQGVSIRTNITNTDNKTIPIGDGWHPYFHFENGIKDVEMKFGPAKRLSSNMGNVLGDTHGYESGLTLDDVEIDDCFEISDETLKLYEITLRDKTNGISVNLSQENGANKYKYFQIYTPPSRKQIALEPVTCPPNALNTGEGLIELQKNQNIQMSFGIRIDKI